MTESSYQTESSYEPEPGGDHDDFYIGYEPSAPPRIASFVRGAVIVLLLLAVSVPLALVASQRPFDKAFFEFGRLRDFEGIVEEQPYATLRVPHPGGEGASRYPLVVPGKRGGASLVEGLEGERVKLRGTLIYRDDQTMIEAQEGSVQAISGAVPLVAPPVSFGRRTFVGEIVDSQCFLGIMKPSTEKPHRACAIRCISGGVPPMLLLRDSEGAAETLMLVGGDGRAIGSEVLDLVADPVEITGELERRGATWVLKAEPETFRRLP